MHKKCYGVVEIVSWKETVGFSSDVESSSSVGHLLAKLQAGWCHGSLGSYLLEGVHPNPHGYLLVHIATNPNFPDCLCNTTIQMRSPFNIELPAQSESLNL